MDNGNSQFFKNFLYEFKQDSDVFQCVLVKATFFYKNIKVIKEMYFPLSANITVNNFQKFTNFVLNEQMKDGSLVKYSEEYARDSKSCKPSIFDIHGKDVTKLYLARNPDVFKNKK